MNSQSAPESQTTIGNRCNGKNGRMNEASRLAIKLRRVGMVFSFMIECNLITLGQQPIQHLRSGLVYTPFPPADVALVNAEHRGKLGLG